MGRIIHGIRDALKELRKDPEPPQTNHYTTPPEQPHHETPQQSHQTPQQPHQAPQQPHQPHQQVVYDDYEKGEVPMATVAVNTNDEEKVKKTKKRLKIITIIALWGFISSAVAIGNLATSGESNGLKVANIILTFVSSLFLLPWVFYLRKTFFQPERVWVILNSIIQSILNIGGVIVCIWLLVLEGASSSWITTLIFHFLNVAASIYQFFYLGFPQK